MYKVYPKCSYQIALDVVGEVSKKRFTARDHGHACCHVANHVMGCKPHPVLFRVQCKVLKNTRKYDNIVAKITTTFESEKKQ